MNSKVRMLAVLVVLGGAFYATPALAQEAEPLVEEQALAEEQARVDLEAGLVNGVFALVLEGEVPADYSFYVEANIGNGGEVICTTDAEMVGLGYAECVGGGEINEVPFVAPEGQDIEYRVLGSQGSGLSQEVVSEGSVVAAEGVRIDATYAFDGQPLEDHTENPIQEPDWEPDADEDQYGVGAAGEETTIAEDAVEEGAVEDEVILAEEAAQNVEPGSIADIATGGTGLLPETGGLPILPVLGAALLIGAALLKRLIP